MLPIVFPHGDASLDLFESNWGIYLRQAAWGRSRLVPIEARSSAQSSVESELISQLGPESVLISQLEPESVLISQLGPESVLISQLGPESVLIAVRRQERNDWISMNDRVRSRWY